jgi:acylphosphatase
VEPALHIIVEGLVQGVGFRYYTQGLADQMDVEGWVRNLPGGHVEILARIPSRHKEAFLAALKAGPPASRVDGLRMKPAPEETDCPGHGFSVRFS